MFFMNGEAAPGISRTEFDNATIPVSYYESLTFAELLAMARYLRAAAEALEQPANETLENAWLQAVKELGQVGIVADERLPTTPLESLIREEIASVTLYGNGDREEDWPYPDLTFLTKFFAGRVYRFVDGDPVEIALQAIMVSKLREGPMLWTDLHRHLLEAAEVDEESVQLHMVLFDSHHAGFVEASTVAEEGLFIDWTTVVRLSDGRPPKSDA